MIQFFYKQIAWRLIPVYTTQKWVLRIIAWYGYQVQELSYIFTNDGDLKTMNKQYLQHDEYTDILTFNYNETQESYIWAEIYISIDRVRENAQQIAVSFYDELHRVMIHGVLHLLGYNDITEAEQKEMRSAEDRALMLRKKY
ncbi:MAG: rRNA maturation RNase YbeY [Bacteroidia bacterium]|nr:rRNA maturation RNase YbeY [Bacteroidia bacterium]MDW8157793.1 rRNA maturation RNase YbeY [Bacteroidia bacterium]